MIFASPSPKDRSLADTTAGAGLIAADADNGALVVGNVPLANSSRPLAPYRTTRSVSVSSHSAYQVIQRTGPSTNVTFRGGFCGQRSAVEVRYAGGAWTPATMNEAAGTWACAMALADGQGTLEARISGDDSTKVSLPYVGVGDVICIGGQSNGAGRGLANQSYSHASLRAACFNKAYTWANLTDPSGDSTGALDAILYDYDAGGMGSVWPLVATGYMAARGRPLGIVPSCKGGTGIALWSPPATAFDRFTLAGAMMYRAQVTGAKLICWWQGEGGIDDTTGASYYVPYMQLSAAVAANLPGVKMMPAMLQHCSSGTVTNLQQNNHRTAISYIWANDANSVTGPTMATTSPPTGTDLTSDDAFHLQSNANLQAAADRWVTRLLSALP